MQPWKKVFLGLLLGILVGALLGDKAAFLKPFGDLFIRLIKMVIAPLIFCSIVSGIAQLDNAKQLGRLGIKSVLTYCACTSFAIFLGFLAAWIFRPGDGLVLVEGPPPDMKAFHLGEYLMNIVPDNAVAAFAQGNMLQVVFFATFTGICLLLMGAKAKPITSAIKEIMGVVFFMVNMIVKLAPLAAFAFMAWCVGTQGTAALFSLSKIVCASVFAFSLQYMVFGLMIFFFGKLKPWPFYRKSIAYQLLAFSTSSSKAALPMTMSTAQEKLGISKLSSSFVLPLGATMNMDGLAIYLGLCAITFAQAAGRVLSLHEYGILLVTATIGSIGGAGIPSGTLLMLPMVLASLQLPLEGVALIVGIDRFMDMIRTTISITGDAAVALVVDSSEKTHNADVYYEA